MPVLSGACETGGDCDSREKRNLRSLNKLQDKKVVPFGLFVSIKAVLAAVLSLFVFKFGLYLFVPHNLSEGFGTV